MPDLDKRKIKIALIIGAVLVCIFYLGTMRRADGQSGSREMTTAMYQGFYVGETGFKNNILAFAVLPSTYSFDGGDGCPCYGIFKPLALAVMLTTWQFYANVLIFSSIVYVALEHRR